RWRGGLGGKLADELHALHPGRRLLVIENRVGPVEALGRDDVLIMQPLALEACGGIARELQGMLAGRLAEFEIVGHGGKFRFWISDFRSSMSRDSSAAHPEFENRESKIKN